MHEGPGGTVELTAARSMGAAWVLDLAWQRLGLGRAFGAPSDEAFPPLERAAFAIVANYALAGGSTAGVPEWVRHDIAIHGAGGLTPADWDRAADRFGEPATREQLERLVLAHARAQEVNNVYLVSDLFALGTRFTLALSGDRWPVLIREWPPGEDPEKMPREWTAQLADELPLRVVVIQPRRWGPPGSARMQVKECPVHGRVRYCRVAGDQQGDVLSIFIQSLDPGGSGRPADHVIEVAGTRPPPDGEVVCAYLDGLRMRLEFAEMLARPLRVPFRGHDRTASARALAAWIALLLTREVERGTGSSWPAVLTEFQRVHQVILTQSGEKHALHTKLTPEQQALIEGFAPG